MSKNKILIPLDQQFSRASAISKNSNRTKEIPAIFYRNLFLVQASTFSDKDEAIAYGQWILKHPKQVVALIEEDEAKWGIYCLAGDYIPISTVPAAKNQAETPPQEEVKSSLWNQALLKHKFETWVKQEVEKSFRLTS